MKGIFNKMGSLPSGVVQILFEEMIKGDLDLDQQHEKELDSNYADIIEAAYQSQETVKSINYALPVLHRPYVLRIY